MTHAERRDARKRAAEKLNAWLSIWDTSLTETELGLANSLVASLTQEMNPEHGGPGTEPTT